MSDVDRPTLDEAEVVVVGGGNAGLCSAIAARSAGAEVLLLERAPEHERGGNSKYTRNLRCIRDGLYEEDEFYQDILGVSDPDVNEDLLRYLIRHSRDLPAWMESHGVMWQPEMNGTIQLGRTNRFFLGGGKALMNVYYERARILGVTTRYDIAASSLTCSEDGVLVEVEHQGTRGTIRAGAVVVACGGYEANLEWLTEHLGEGARRYAIRGCRFNDGALITSLLSAGASSRGVPGRVHAVAVDDRCPQYDGGIVSRVDSIPFGIVVNQDARRFADEGQEIWPKRYASWGKLIADQRMQLAFSIFESRYRGQFIPPAYPPYEAASIPELAEQLGLDGTALARTVDEYNAATPDHAVSRVTALDGRGTTGLTPPKSHWASPLSTPPFCAYAVRPGITFTFFSLAVDERARVLDKDNGALPGIYGAGEAIAGNFLSKGYLAGFGMTIGAVFGRIAGEEAAAHVRRSD